ncbi:MAG: NapC/NirT family cytochrome c [Candidatus Solibacter usitatus]|nr:NapC/NirT family cytochrome c [Candidatus Solibacter usitatus]
MNRLDVLSPVVYLSNNWLSLTGVLLVTTSTVFWLFLLPANFGAETVHPYLGILIYLLLPGGFFGGLAMIPLGIYLESRREKKSGEYPASFPPLDLRHTGLRRLLAFVVLATGANLVIASQFTYHAVNYMDSVNFCGQTCHSVMSPEFTAYQNSPHSRVECVKCHIGPGAGWFVKSKLSGVGQVFAVTFNTYPRPIPAPVHNLRPARETCETCHWPQKYGEDRLRVFRKFGDDEANTRTETVLLIRIGGGNGGPGIHGAHLGEGVGIRYAHTDEKRQEILWVERRDKDGKTTRFQAPDSKSGANAQVREMDCMDCHNRPTHIYELPERAVDNALASGAISPALPFIKKKSVELLKTTTGAGIPAALAAYYRDNHAPVFSEKRAEIERAAAAVRAIYDRNVFPQMKVTWGTYINNIGHTDFPGCFRCHDDTRAASDGRKLTQDCNTCHSLLAMDEAGPKILSDLGIGK